MQTKDNPEIYLQQKTNEINKSEISQRYRGINSEIKQRYRGINSETNQRYRGINSEICKPEIQRN